MNISAKTEYACIAVLELAARAEQGRPVRVREIADANGIPSRFLVQILLQLKAAGIVGSTRGAAGGYQLMRAPSDITLAEVMKVSEGQSSEPTSSADRETPTTRVLLQTWRQVSRTEQEMLEGITFADLLETARAQNENMYYI